MKRVPAHPSSFAEGSATRTYKPTSEITPHAHLRLRLRKVRSHLGRISVDYSQADEKVSRVQEAEGTSPHRLGRGDYFQRLRLLPDRLSQRIVQESRRVGHQIAVR